MKYDEMKKIIVSLFKVETGMDLLYYLLGFMVGFQILNHYYPCV